MTKGVSYNPDSITVPTNAKGELNILIGNLTQIDANRNELGLTGTQAPEPQPQPMPQTGGTRRKYRKKHKKRYTFTKKSNKSRKSRKRRNKRKTNKKKR